MTEHRLLPSFFSHVTQFSLVADDEWCRLSSPSVEYRVLPSFLLGIAGIFPRFVIRKVFAHTSGLDPQVCADLISAVAEFSSVADDEWCRLSRPSVEYRVLPGFLFGIVGVFFPGKRRRRPLRGPSPSIDRPGRSCRCVRASVRRSVSSPPHYLIERNHAVVAPSTFLSLSLSLSLCLTVSLSHCLTVSLFLLSKNDENRRPQAQWPPSPFGVSKTSSLIGPSNRKRRPTVSVHSRNFFFLWGLFKEKKPRPLTIFRCRLHDQYCGSRNNGNVVGSFKDDLQSHWLPLRTGCPSSNQRGQWRHGRHQNPLANERFSKTEMSLATANAPLFICHRWRRRRLFGFFLNNGNAVSAYSESITECCRCGGCSRCRRRCWPVRRCSLMSSTRW